MSSTNSGQVVQFVYKKKTYDSYLLNNIPKDLINKQKKQENKYKSYKLSLSSKLKDQDQKYNQYFLNNFK